MENTYPGGVASNFGHQLDGAGGAADHRDPFPLEVDSMVPSGGVKLGTCKLFSTGYFREGRTTELSGPSDQDIGFVDVALVRGQDPNGSLCIKLGMRNLGAESDLSIYIIFSCTGFEISKNFGLRRPFPGPLKTSTMV